MIADGTHLTNERINNSKIEQKQNQPYFQAMGIIKGIDK